MAGREFEIIGRYFSGFVPSEGENVVLGPGDDCAILRLPPDKELCISTDTLIGGVHFPAAAPGAVVAHRSLAASVSDLAAMGAECLAFTLALTMTHEDETWLDEFSATLGSLVSKYGIPLVGGNLARGELSVTMTVLGTLPPGKAMRRGGAHEGDDLYVSGTLGDAAGGLSLLRSGEELDGHLVERYLYPRPRLELGQALLGLATACIDISDGLAADLGHICEASGVGARVCVDDMPMSQPLVGRFGQARALELAVGAGDDYELCFAAPVAARETIERIRRDRQTPVTRIGSFVAGEGAVFVDSEGNRREFSERGYQHFHEA